LPSSRRSPPGLAVVDVWWAGPGDERAEHVNLLDDGEIGRRREYRRDVDRARFTVAAALLRTAAGAVLGRAPRDVEVDRTCSSCGGAHGRPRLPGTRLHASITHAGDCVAVALTEDGPVGVDVEAIGPVEPALFGHVVAPDEPFALDEHAFFVHWVRKEAVLKATGEGLQRAMTSVVLGRPDEPPRLVRYGDRRPRAGTGAGVAMADLDASPGHVACVAVVGADRIAVRRHDGAALLAGTTPNGARTQLSCAPRWPARA
jgi:4'-phosphopantetheinyl transferase